MNCLSRVSALLHYLSNRMDLIRLFAIVLICPNIFSLTLPPYSAGVYFAPNCTSCERKLDFNSILQSYASVVIFNNWESISELKLHFEVILHSANSPKLFVSDAFNIVIIEITLTYMLFSMLLEHNKIRREPTKQ